MINIFSTKHGEAAVRDATGVADEVLAQVEEKAPIYCFFVDDAFFDESALESICYVLERFGFDRVHHFDYCKRARRALSLQAGIDLSKVDTNSIRGVIVAADVCPLVSERENRKTAFRNRRINLLPSAEEWVRDELERGEIEGAEGVVAVTAHVDITLAFLNSISPELAQLCVSRSLELAASVESPFPIARRLGGMCYNARVFIVDYYGVQAACKVFRPGRHGRFESERDALLRLTGSPYAPDLLEAGENWVLMTVIRGVSMQAHPRTGLFPLTEVKEAFEVLAGLYDKGVIHLDFHPSNLKRASGQELKVHDFEGSYIWTRQDVPPSFWDSPIFRGAAAVEEYEMPAMHARWFCRAYPEGIYQRFWYDRVGLTLDSLRFDPAPLQHAKRAVFVLKNLMSRITGGIAHRLYRWQTVHYPEGVE